MRAQLTDAIVQIKHYKYVSVPSAADGVQHHRSVVACVCLFGVHAKYAAAAVAAGDHRARVILSLPSVCVRACVFGVAHACANMCTRQRSV